MLHCLGFAQAAVFAQQSLGVAFLHRVCAARQSLRRKTPHRCRYQTGSLASLQLVVSCFNSLAFGQYKEHAKSKLLKRLAYRKIALRAAFAVLSENAPSASASSWSKDAANERTVSSTLRLSSPQELSSEDVKALRDRVLTQATWQRVMQQLRPRLPAEAVAVLFASVAHAGRSSSSSSSSSNSSSATAVDERGFVQLCNLIDAKFTVHNTA